MIVDASALLAILLREPEQASFRLKIAQAREPVMSPFNYLEAATRVDTLGEPVSSALDQVMTELGIKLLPATPEQAKLAREAYRRFGKGNHEAKLNLGDCFAYALARVRSEPLLFKGGDFRLTDVEAAL